MITIDISLGEALDRLSILWVKRDNIRDEKKKKRVIDQCNRLEMKLTIKTFTSDVLNYYETLKNVNLLLWTIEDEIRGHVRGDRFKDLASQIIRLNDQRSEIKQTINELVGDDGEVKEYA